MDLDLNKIADHVRDLEEFEFPYWIGEGGKVHLPKVPGLGLQLTKYMVLELIAAALMLWIFIALARKMKSGGAPKGFFWNFFEVLLLFIRDEVARPSIGKHDADKYVPFLWNLFFFILFCNLLGMVPFCGSPTGSLSVTGVLALISFAVVVGTGIAKFGAWGYLKSLAPHLDLPLPLKIAVLSLLFPIEIAGLLIKHAVLAMRLLANMFAGHLVLAVVISFVTLQTFFLLRAGITVTSVPSAAALNLLELFVAFLQAYIFTFLTALFIGMSAHPH
jgi:F-type H+-transporting ATPase subunit a